ncbi:hypothetical protein A7K98_11615 [Tatumella citrea]|uniref:Uncharacterized protein n=1 Tax=Tatumella citrea TaxID=53336 RepID=A0A1Y0L8I3_TATCI|nr:hypothetical protein A7K98_11615 [Tatumella citrea]
MGIFLGSSFISWDIGGDKQLWFIALNAVPFHHISVGFFVNFVLMANIFIKFPGYFIFLSQISSVSHCMEFY